MHVVIDIPEKIYEQLKFLNKQDFGTVIDEAVANGTPLPKGHGRLGDLDALREEVSSWGWINIDATHSKCDKCGAIFEIASENGEANYCPNCGAKMIEQQESEDKE